MARDRRVDGIETDTGGNPGRMRSLISKRFEPAQHEWLSSPAEDASEHPAVLQRARRHLITLHRVSELLATARDLQGLADATLRAILEVTDADRAALLLRRADPETGDAEVVATRTRVPGEARFAVSRSLVADVIDNGVSTFADDVVGEAEVGAGPVRSVLCVPLRTTDQVLGALYVDSESVPRRFNEADLELLAAIGNQAGTALHRVRLMGELSRLLIDAIRAIAATIDAKDGYTQRHSERVAALSKRIAAALGFDETEQDTVELSALLHDVGKIAVPDSILNKAGSLTADEFDEMKKHPAHGARILANIQSASVKAVLPGIHSHHEKWDGTGYPEGLRGDAIPILGRLLSVADFFDALTSTRSYRTPMPVDDVVALIRDKAGTHFDPRIADLVVRLHQDGELLPPDWES
jgi:HD-GYP domain-containing protein (c-di-GMP phosphodiesterase class II)